MALGTDVERGLTFPVRVSLAPLPIGWRACWCWCVYSDGKMADITPDMARDFFNFSKPLPKVDKPTVAIKGPRTTESNAYVPEFKLQKKNSTATRSVGS